MSTPVVEAAAPPKPGLYRNVPFNQYWSWDAVNHSILQGFAGRTPAHVRWELDHGGKDPTPALDLGWLTHLAVLEPERFDAEVTIAPKIDKRTNVGKASWAQWQAANEGKHYVDADDHRKALAMRASLLAHPTAGEFLRSKGGAVELSVVWEEKAAGVLCKGRIDRVGYVGEYPVIADIKTARSASRRDFERAVLQWNYHTQAMHYLKGLEALAPIPEGNPPRRFVFFVVESEPPHLVSAFELDDQALAQAETDRQRYLRTWRRCVESGEWNGFPSGIELCGLPAWAYRKFEDID
jgi:hypothetical protein